MIIVWTEVALAQLDAIHDYIALDSPDHARNTRDKIVKKCADIAKFPFAGRMMPESNFQQIREVLEGVYRIVYHMTSTRIEVIAVLHGSQRTPWSEEFPNR